MIKAQEAGMLPDSFSPLETAVPNSEFDEQDRLIRYSAILESSFGPDMAVPTDPEDRVEFDFMKRKLEIRIAKLAGDPNMISAVAEHYYNFSGVTEQVRNK